MYYQANITFTDTVKGTRVFEFEGILKADSMSDAIEGLSGYARTFKIPHIRIAGTISRMRELEVIIREPFVKLPKPCSVTLFVGQDFNIITDDSDITCQP